MSFLTTQPEAMAAAATNLQAINTAMTAQNASAAAPITGLLPAAGDAVSSLQATQFSAYGILYQQISAQAAAIQDMFVHTLRTGADSYENTEAANAAAGAAQSTPVDDLGQSGMAGITQVSNFGSAASDLLQLGSSGFLAPGALANASEVTGGATAAMLTGAAEPVATSVNIAAPGGLAGASQAASLSRLATPASWAGAAEPAVAAATPAQATGWTATAAAGTPTGAVPAGMPAAASAERGGHGFGRPRYGVKPTVVPRPAVN